MVTGSVGWLTALLMWFDPGRPEEDQEDLYMNLNSG